MRIFRALVVFLIRVVAPLLVKLDASELARVPRRGPFIIAANHVNFLDGPLLLSRLFPRRVAALAKKETWRNPFLGLAATAIGAVPLDRDLADPSALRKVSALLAEDGFLYVNPEGTRSRDGVLRGGKAGIVAIARRSGSPILPVAFEGLEDFGPSIRRLRRVRARIRVGAPFELAPPPAGSPREGREESLREIMLRIAALLPASKRGAWSTPEAAVWRWTKEVASRPLP